MFNSRIEFNRHPYHKKETEITAENTGGELRQFKEEKDFNRLFFTRDRFVQYFKRCLLQNESINF